MRLTYRFIAFTFFNWDIRCGFTARHSWTHFRIHHGESTWHLVWGRFSLHIENWTLEIHKLCGECGSADIGEVCAGDEGWTVCGSCRAIEQSIKYVNLREYESAQ